MLAISSGLSSVIFGFQLSPVALACLLAFAGNSEIIIIRFAPLKPEFNLFKARVKKSVKYKWLFESVTWCITAIQPSSRPSGVLLSSASGPDRWRRRTTCDCFLCIWKHFRWFCRQSRPMFFSSIREFLLVCKYLTWQWWRENKKDVVLGALSLS